ncbi:MAG TPA: hypothetical protein VHN99_07650 [Deinococcales bacterium]|nr:hypothetical protein [Deinococcales bacterium]
MTYDAYEARELTGTVLLRDPDLMARWKDASAREAVLARTINGTNYAVLTDPDLAAEIRRLHGGELSLYSFDDEANTVTLARAGDRTPGFSGSGRDQGGNA